MNYINKLLSKREIAYVDSEPPFEVTTINKKRGKVPPTVVCDGPGNNCSHCQIYHSSAIACVIRIPSNGSEVFLCGKADKNERP